MSSNNQKSGRKAKTVRWRVALAVAVSAILSLAVGLLSNLATTYIAPNFSERPEVVYIALALTFLCALPLTVYLALRSLPTESDSSVPAHPSSLPPSIEAPKPQTALLPQLPGKTYRDLVGRDGIVGEALAALRDPSGKWMVSIDGMGGIGKTALARELAERCLDSRLFDFIVWESAANQEQAASRPRRGLTYEAVLDAIGRNLGDFEVSKLSTPEKEDRIRMLLRNRRVLIVLDNLETAKDSGEEIARRLRPLLEPSKAILTSRRRLEGDTYAIHLTGLNEDGAVQFIKQECDEKGINLQETDHSELRRIAQVTDGSPLALKLVVGLINRLDLNIVLDQLQNVRLPQGDSDESDYVRFYKHIFSPSWRLISTEAKSLLISMAHFAPGVGGTLDSIKTISNKDETGLAQAIDELWRFSLVEVSKTSSLKQVRYYLHSLTRYFVLSDIVKLPGWP